MAGPITQRMRSSNVTGLVLQIAAALPPGTALFVVAVGPLDGKGGREVALGGETNNAEARVAGADVLLGDQAHTTLVSATPFKQGMN